MLQEAPIENLLGRLNDVEQKFKPPTLYAAGRVELLRRRPRVAVIGSREASTQGLSFAREIATAIVERRGVVVSGLAEGVDTAAHRAAIEAGGDTIAVIGTPLSRCYPKENAALQEELAQHHLVVSEFPEGSPTTPKSFVIRNRTMALVSHGSVIVEAGEDSGTRHQGWEAIRLGRTLFLPQSLAEASFEWPRKMVAYGAVVFRDASAFGALLDELLPGVPKEELGSDIRF